MVNFIYPWFHYVLDPVCGIMAKPNRSGLEAWLCSLVVNVPRLQVCNWAFFFTFNQRVLIEEALEVAMVFRMNAQISGGPFYLLDITLSCNCGWRWSDMLWRGLVFHDLQISCQELPNLIGNVEMDLKECKIFWIMWLVMKLIRVIIVQSHIWVDLWATAKRWWSVANVDLNVVSILQM